MIENARRNDRRPRPQQAQALSRRRGSHEDLRHRRQLIEENLGNIEVGSLEPDYEDFRDVFEDSNQMI